MNLFKAKLALFSSAIFAVASVMSMDSFDTSFVELDTSKMITTSDSNFAICDHHFPSNWRSASVNGDEVTIATKDSQVLKKKYSQLSHEEKSYLEHIKAKLVSMIRLGPFGVKSETGFAKLTTFDRYGGTSTIGSSGGGSSSSSSSSSTSSSTSSSSNNGMGGAMSVTKTGKDSYIVCKSDFPFNWQRVFINEDVDTIVYKNGRVIMLPEAIMQPDERAKAAELRAEVEKSTRATEKLAGSFINSLSNPMDFVSKTFGGIFG